MKYLGKITDPKDLVNKEYVDNADLNKVDKNGDTMTGNLVVPAIRSANTYYGLTFGRTTSTPVETILYTGIKWDSSSHMPVIHITGYAYGLASPVEFKIGFYIYNNIIGWCGATNMGSWEPNVYLFKHTVDSQDYVAVGLAGSCYFLQLQADLQDEMGKFSHTNLDSSLWSWAFSTTTGNIPTPDGGVTCVAVPYKANILKPAKAISADEAVKIKQTVASSEDDCFPTGADEVQFFRSSTITASGGDGHIIGFKWGNTAGYGAQIHIDTDPTYCLSIRQRNGSGVWQPWKKIYTENDAINASKVNSHTVNSDVPANAIFTDTVTTATTTGTGNAVTAVSASDGALTVTKGATFLTSYTETDPTVPSWAKASSKPTYTASEVGAQPTLVSGTNIKTINNQSLLGSGNISISGGTGSQTTWYGTCSTAASTTAKVVTCSGFTLTDGAIIGVLFSTANTASTPTLNVNSTGAKSIYIGSTVTNGTTNVLKWSTYTLLYFMYDGTNWIYMSSQSAGSGTPSRGAGTWYGTCSTAASTEAKGVTCDNFVLTKGSLITITFTYGNTADSPTLNINSTGAKSTYRGFIITSSTNPLKWSANDTLTFMYDGTYYRFISETNKTFSQPLTMSSSFTYYDSDTANTPIFKVSGNVCDISGVVTPKAAIAGSATRTTICNIPEGYEPDMQLVTVCQGSGNARWICEVGRGATAVTFSRYCNTGSAANAYISCAAGQWLPFHLTWII